MTKLNHLSAAAISFAFLIGFHVLQTNQAFAQEATRIEAGDTLNIQVYQVPELSRRALVDVSGAIEFPTIGSVKVRGYTVEEVRATVTSRLMRTGFFESPQVLVEIAQTRPVYISGDVSKPGEYEYRSSLSIRQLAALAGGYDILNFRSQNPMVQLPDFKSERDANWLELTRQEIRTAFLQAELNGTTNPVLPEPNTYPLNRSIFNDTVATEANLFQLRAGLREGLKEHLQRIISLSDEQIAALQEQRRQEELTVRQLNADLAQTQSLFSRGLTSVARVQDQQRSISLAQSRAAEATANIARAGREKEEFSRQLRTLNDERRTELLGEIEKGITQAQLIRLRITAATEKLLYLGALRSHLLGGSRGEASFVIYRNEHEVRRRIIADEDTSLLPGDVVEVSLSYAPTGTRADPPCRPRQPILLR